LMGQVPADVIDGKVLLAQGDDLIVSAGAQNQPAMGALET
jgi:hypothetical protein